MDDCPLYPLAQAQGAPLTTDPTPSDHVRGYEQRLGMDPVHIRNARFNELVVFEDTGQNRDKHGRFRAMSDALRARVNVVSHPGVFIIRGRAGDRRGLRNERGLAERLAQRRGFCVIDPLESDVPTIVQACAGARVVIGVEGSALIHGVMVLEPGAAVVTPQPPRRFCGLYKHLTDRDGQHFAFVVGQPRGQDFWVDPDEVERTLELLPR